MTRIALTLLCTILAAASIGCAGSAEIESTDDGRKIIRVSWRGEEAPAQYVREDAIPEPPEPTPPTEADLIAALAELSGDKALGAELVIIAAKAGKQNNHDDEDNRLNSLRLANWFQSRQDRRVRGVAGVESRARRAFGETE